MRDQARVDGGPRAAGRRPSLGAAPLLFVLIYLIWGFTYVAVRIGLRDVGPLTLAGARSLIAAIGLGAVALALRRPLPPTLAAHAFIAAVGRPARSC
jgi:drug/metabolite transporter (DMT)-like permease